MVASGMQGHSSALGTPGPDCLLAREKWGCGGASLPGITVGAKMRPWVKATPFVGPYRKESKAGKKELSGESNAGLELGEAGQADGYQEMKTSM